MQAMAAASESADAAFKRIFAAPPAVEFFAPGRVNLLGEHVDYVGGTVLPACLTAGARVVCARLRRSSSASAPSGLLIHATADGATLRVEADDIDAADAASALQRLRECHHHPGPPLPAWAPYALGALRGALRSQPVLGGGRCPEGETAILITGDLPLGAGVSSSAALCVALWQCGLWLARDCSGGVGEAPPACIELSASERLAMAVGAQQVEAEYVGANVGLMDPYAAVFGVSGAFLELRCGTTPPSHVAHPLPPTFLAPLSAPDGNKNTHSTGGSSADHKAELVLFNSMKSHHLGGGEYNAIRHGIERAEAALRAALAREQRQQRQRATSDPVSFTFAAFAANPAMFLGGIDPSDGEAQRAIDILLALLDAPGADVTAEEAAMGRYVLEEIVRVQRFVSIMAARPFTRDSCRAIGALLNATHRGLAEQLRVSTPTIDYLHATLKRLPGVHGARLIGGGFGGCVLALIDGTTAEDVSADVRAAFAAYFPEIGPCDCIPVRLGGGASMRILSQP